MTLILNLLFLLQDYGKTPAYLAKRADEVRRAQDDYDAYISEHFRRGAMQSLTVADRTMLLDGLKSNWEELHHQYQGLSVVTDTAPKKNRKERMEAEMKQLEKDIETIEKHRVIYIANWGETYCNLTCFCTFLRKCTARDVIVSLCGICSKFIQLIVYIYINE